MAAVCINRGTLEEVGGRGMEGRKEGRKEMVLFLHFLYSSRC